MNEPSPAPLSSPQPTYSPFLPVLIVFLSIGVSQAVSLSAQWREQRQLKEGLVQLAPQVQKARVISSTMENLSKDLIQLSATSPAAKQIVDNYKIQLVQPRAAQK